MIFLLGSVLEVVAIVWLLIKAFLTYVPWGIAFLLLPPFGAIGFMITHFQDNKKPIALLGLGMALSATGLFLGV